MLRVFITIDVEMWPRSMDMRRDDPAALFERDILGRTPTGDFGIEHQMNVLDRHGLRGVFLVEALHAIALGPPFLRDTVNRITRRGHDVQLHIHPEWLSATDNPPQRMFRAFWELPRDRQAALLARGAGLLRAAGAANVRAFRAGSYAANNDTLSALESADLLFDTSYNPALLGSHCRIATDEPLLAPRRISGALELPVSCFAERASHLRHTQLAACSSRELERALSQAERFGWWSFVVVSHSFELIRRDHQTGSARPDAIANRRFERLCRFLAAHPDRFETCTFAELDPAEIPVDLCPPPATSNVVETAWRLSEQLRRRLA